MNSSDALEGARNENTRLSEELRTLRGQWSAANKVVRESDNPQEVASARTAVNALGDRIEKLNAEQSRGLGNMRRLTEGGGLAHGLRGERAFDSPEMASVLEQMANSSAPIGRMALGELQSAGSYADMLATGQWGWNAAAQGNVMAAGPGPVSMDPQIRYAPSIGVVPALRRRLSVLDLIPTVEAPAGASFFYESESFTDTARETAELALKPEADWTGTPNQVTFATVAHYIKVARQSLSDVPQLGQSLQNRLTYGVNLRLENAILGGDGAGVDIRGVLNTTGVQSVAFSGATPLADLVLQGITALQAVFAEPQAVVVSPATWQNLLTPKSSGSGEYLNVGQGPIGLAQALSLWSLPVVVSAGMPANKALVGDFQQGTQLYIRQGLTLLTSDSDEDDFVRNRLTLLAELRAGLAVFQPAAFAVVNLA